MPKRSTASADLVCMRRAFVPYGSTKATAALPIPTTKQPSFVGSAQNISYPDIAASALLNFTGGATTYFGLRFTGASCCTNAGWSVPMRSDHMYLDRARIRSLPTLMPAC